MDTVPQSPCVFRMRNIKQRYPLVGIVLELDELHVSRVGSQVVRRGVHDFADHNRADSWPGVRLRKRQCELRREVFLAIRGNPSAKGNAILGRAKFKSVHVPGQRSGGIGREQINLLAK